MITHEFVGMYQVCGVPDLDQMPLVDLYVRGSWTVGDPPSTELEREWAMSLLWQEYVERTGTEPVEGAIGIMRWARILFSATGPLVTLDLLPTINSELTNPD